MIRPFRLAGIAALALGLSARSLAAAGPAPPVPAPAAPLKVIATVPTWGALATTIGGDLVDVVVLTRPGQDVHAVTATPSFMARVRGADLLLHTGLDAETWLPALLRGSGNVHLLPGSDRAVDLVSALPYGLKEVPGRVDRQQGDVHAWGNIHVWTDPLAVRSFAAAVADALAEALPGHEQAIRSRQAAFHERLTRALVGWLTDAAAVRGRPVVTYHRSWIYLLDRLGLERLGTLEPKPRVAPTASHLDGLIHRMREREVRVVIREPYQHPDAAEFVAEATGARVLELSTHPGFPEGTEDIVDHFEHNIGALLHALAPPEDSGP